MAKRYIWDFNAPAGGNLKTWDEWESEQAERSLDLMNAVKSPGIKTYKPGELDLYDSSITPEHVDKNALLDALSTSQKPSLVKRIEDSKAWRTVIGNPEEGYGVGDMAEAVMMANPAVTGMAAGKGLQGAGTVLKKVGDPALDALKTALFKTPAPVKKLAGAGAAITGYETIKGATDPEYADRRETFPSQFGASLRGGVGDAVKLAGSAAEWQGKDKLADTLKQAGIDISEGFESKQVPFTWKSWFDPDWYANNVARTIPTTAALIPAMVIAYKGGAQGAAMRGFGKFGQAVIGSLAGAAASRPLESAMEAGGAYEDALARGLSTEEAEAAAQKVYEANLSLAGLDAAQLALAFAPQGKLAGLAGRIGKTGVAASKLAGVALTEAGEEGYQQAVQQSATGADQRGILAQMLNPNTEMKESMAIGGLFGVGMGGAGVINDVFANPADLPDRIQQDVAANLPPELKTQVAQNIENFMDQGMDEAAATEKALDELAETPEGQEIIASSTQTVANEMLGQAAVATQAPQAEQIAQPQQETAEAPAPSIVYDRATGEPLQVVGQPNPEFYIVQNQAGKRRLAQIGDVTIGVPAAQETGQAPAEETNVPPQAAQELTGEAVPQPQPQAAIKVQPEQTAAAQSETEAGVNDTTWYHGTGKQGLTPEAIDPLIGNHEALFGHGVYLTDSPNVAQGYAKARSKKSGAPSVYEVKVNVNSTLDLEGEVAPEFSEIMLSNSEFDPGVRQTVQEAINEKGATNESVMQAYRHALEEYSADSQIPSSELVENFQDILIDLKRAGYDALTHAGGKRTGGAPHRVLIMLDPNDISGTGRKDQITAFSQLNNVPEEKPATANSGVVLEKPEAYNETKDDIKFLRGDGDQTGGGEKTNVDSDRGRDTDSLHSRETERIVLGGQNDEVAERRISDLTQALRRIPDEDFRTDELRAADAGEYEKADVKKAVELAGTYGSEVFLFRWENPGPRYFSATLVGNVIYIDADSNESSLNAVSHEIIHYLKRNKPGIYDAVKETATNHVTAKKFIELKPAYLVRGYAEEDVLEELICDIGAQVLLKSNGMEGAFFAQEEWNNLFGSKENASKAEEAIGKVLAEGAVKDTSQKSPPEGQGPKLKRETGAKAPIFYSQLQQVIEQKMPNNTVANHVLAIIRIGKINAEEVKWSGIEEWLKGKKGRVNKEEVLAFLKSGYPMLEGISKDLGLNLKPAPRAIMRKRSLYSANALAKIFTGKDLVTFNGKGVQGVALGDTIFLNENTKDPVLYVTKHEIVHTLENTDPDAYNQLMEFAKEHYDGNPAMFKHYELYGYDADETWKEFTSDVVSEIMESDGFWAQVREKAPEMVRSIIDIIDNIIAQYKKAVGKDMTMLIYIKNMEQFKDKVAGVTAETLVRRQQGTVKPGAGGEVAAKTSLKREKEAINTANAKTEAERLNDQNMLEFFQKVIEEYGIKSTPEALYQQVFKKEMSAEVRQRIMKNTLQDRYVGWRNEDSRAVSAQKDMQAFVGARILKARSEGNKDGTLPPVARRDIVKFLSDKLDIPIRVGRYRSKGALGIFKIRPEVIRTRLAEDIEVISHEIGHYLDKRLGLQSRHYDQEMKALAHGLKGPTREEGVAQFVNFWLTNPKKAKQLAPRYYESFQSKLDDNPEIAEVLESAQKQINTWLTQPAMERVLGQLSVGEGTLKRPMTFDRIYTAVVDELRPLENAVKSITQGHSIDDMVNPYLAAWAARGWRGKAEAAIHYGQFDNNLKKAGPSLNEILKKVDKQLDEFRAFITAKRTLELNERNISSGITAEDANDVINGFDAKTTKLFEDTFKELIEFQDYIMNQAVESGLVSKEALKTMRELNRNYVPFYRLFDESMQQQGFAGKTFANLASPIKSIKGSQRTIIDPIESIIKNTYTLINLSERQHVGRLLANLAARFEGSGKVLEKIATPMMPVNFPLKQLEKLLNAEGVDTDSIDLEHIATIFKPNYFAPRGKENILIIFNNGKPEFYQVAPELYRAMLFLDKESSNILDKLLTYPTSLLRAGATLTPEFIARNPVRDQFSAFVNSKYGFVPGVDLIRGLAHVIKKDELYWRWYQSGGAHGAFVSVDRDYLQKDMRKLLRREFKEKLADTLTHPMEVLRMLSEYTEEATRVMEFGKGLKKEGADRAKIAAIASRDITLDFSRAGHTGKAMNRWIAFLNAGIQGVDKMVRQFDPRDPQKAVMSTLKSVIAITLPTIILFALNKDNEYYQEIPRWEKDVFWLIPYNGGKNFIRIPKPFELGIIFGTIPERFMEYIYSQDSSAFDEIGETVKKYVFLDLVPDKDYMFAPPGLMPTALLPIMECWANKSSFTGYQIIPSREEGLEPGLQYGPTTSETAKIIGDAAGISPRKIEQMIYGYTAGMGRNVVTGTDWLLEKIGVRQRTPKPEGGLADIPLIKGFISTNPRSGQSITIERFYKDYNDAEVLYKSLDTRISNGENITADSLSKREIALLLSRKTLRKIAGELSDVRKVQRQVLGDKGITKENKQELLHRTDVMQINIVRGYYGQELLEP